MHENQNRTAKYTKGPWKLEAGRNIVTSSGRFYLTYGSEPRTGVPYFSNFVELDANARLIALAPRMVDALRLCVEALKDYPQYDDDSDETPSLEAEALESVRAILREIDEE